MGEAVAGLAEFFGGMLALCIVLALVLVASIIQSVASYLHVGAIPLVGGAIMGAIDGVVDGLTWLKNWLWAHCNPVTLGLAVLGQTLQVLSGNSWYLAVAMYNHAVRTTTVSIPNAISTAEATAYANYTQAMAAYNALRVSLDVALDGIKAQEIADNATTLTNAEHYTDAAGQRGALALTAVELAIQAQLLGLRQTLQGWAVDQLDTLHATIDQQIAASGAGVAGQIGDAINGVEAKLGVGIAAAAAVGTAAAAAFSKWEQDCGNNLCSNLSGFANEIGALLNLVSDGALVALIAGAVTNPQGTVDFIVNDIAGPVDTAIDDVFGLVHWPPTSKAA